MAVRYVKELLQSEIVNALKLGLSKDFFPVIKVDDLAGSFEGVDSKRMPILIVTMPEEQNVSPLSHNISECQYEVTFVCHVSGEKPHDIEKVLSQAQDLIRVDLCDYESDNMRRLAWCRNNITFSDGGFERKGQNSFYVWTGQYKLWIPTTRRVEVPDPPPEPDDDEDDAPE